MAKQVIGLGSSANDGTGDTLRAAGDKINDNFTELYDGKQDLDSDLTAIAGLSASNDDFLQRKLGAWANRTVAQVATDLQTPFDSRYQGLDSDLTSIAGLSPSNDDIIQRKAGAWINRTMAQLATDLTGLISGSDMPVTLATGLSVSDGAANRTALQSQLDTAVAAGRSLLLPVGTYPINATGSTTNRYCLKPTDQTKFMSLIIPPGCTLKIADSQVTDSNPVKLIHLGTHTGGSYIGWPFGGYGGTLDCNTSNQAGWTGGYAQFNGNCHIFCLDGSNNISVENIKLVNCFSNPINLGSANDYGSNSNVRLRNLICENFGEGIQVISFDGGVIENVEHIINRTNWAGDGLELSHCRRFTLKGITTRTSDGLNATVGGAGIDFYASKQITLDGFFIDGPVYPFQIDANYSDNTKFPDQIAISNGVVAKNNAWMTVTNGRISIANVKFLASNGSGPQLSRDYASGYADYTFENCYFGGATSFTVGDNVKLRMKDCVIEDTSTTIDGLFACNSCELDIDGLRASTTDTDAAIISLSASKTLTGRMINVHAPGVNDTDGYVFRAGASATYTAFTLQSNSLLESVAGAQAGIVGANYWEGSGTLTSADMPKGTKGQVIQLSGRYGLSLTHGARLKLANAVSVTLPQTTQDNLFLKYDDVNDIWFEVSRSFVSAANRIVSLPGTWNLQAPAANSTISMGPAVYVPRACSIRSIDVYNGDNGTVGTATVEVREWGTMIDSQVATYLGGTVSRAPGVVPIAAASASKIELFLVTSSDWVSNGNTITASVTLWE